MYGRSNKYLLAAGIMAKNETATLPRTLESIRGKVDVVVFEDTGSTDGTQALVKEWCEEAKIPLVLFEAPMVDFSTSRNRLLDKLEDLCWFALLLDCNDELRYADGLKQWCHRKAQSIKYRNVQKRPADVTNDDVWWAKHDNGLYSLMYHLDPGATRYAAPRLLRMGTGWKYQGRIQEVLWKTGDNGKAEYACQEVLSADGNQIMLYQERSTDAIKSIERMKTRDIAWFMEDIADNVNPARSWFYLGQTYRDIGNDASCSPEDRAAYYEKGVDAYVKRLEYGDSNTPEEMVISYFEIGKMAIKLKRSEPEIAYNLNTAWRISFDQGCERAEPLVALGIYYREREMAEPTKPGYRTMACATLSAASKIELPPRGLFIEKETYTFWRWFYLGVVGYYVPAYEGEGYQASILAEKEYLLAESEGRLLPSAKQNIAGYIKRRIERGKKVMGAK